MKFSYSLIKKLVPELHSAEHLRDLLSAHLFEVESIEGNTIDIKILPNRYSDAASHLGIAREVAAILNTKVVLPKSSVKKFSRAAGELDLIVKVEERKLCPRYMARYFEIEGVSDSPDWMQASLISCGMRPINAVVDIMNYAMLFTGQPLHAFDADKLKSIIVRRAAPEEKIETLDGNNLVLSGDDLVIADGVDVLAIAVIKGGKRAEVTAKTKRIIIEAANFDAAAVYKTSKKLKLATDASVRFSHNLSPALPEKGLFVATELLAEICGARVGEVVDIYPVRVRPVILKFSEDELQKILGVKISKPVALGFLKRLGFAVSGDRVRIPAERMDIERFEDLADEIIRLYGYDKLPAVPPHAALRPTEHDDKILLKSRLRDLLAASGFSEVYNYSFISSRELDLLGKKDAPALKNPISAEYEYLRPGLASGLLKNIEDNFRFFDAVRLFEIGRVFELKDGGVSEKTVLGLALADKKQNLFFEAKGVVDEILRRLGLIDRSLQELGMDIRFIVAEESLRVESDHHVLGYIGTVKENISRNTIICELDIDKLLQLVTEEREYEPISKYPAVTRDISLLINRDVRMEKILQIIQEVSPKLVYDVDLIDYYEDDSKLGAEDKSLTFRIVFQSSEKTLTDEEVGGEMEKIISVLRSKFTAEIR